MNFTGRWMLTIVLIFISLLWLLFHGWNADEVHYIDLLFIVLYAVVGWWFGRGYDREKRYAMKDYLTDLYNRRFVYEVFPKLSDQAKRNKERFSLFVVDVNQFKRINDTFGHKVGDQVLISIAEVLKTSTRKGDVVARWGGDEFLVMTFNTKGDANESIMQRFISDLESKSKEMNVPFDVAIGMAVFPDDAELFGELLDGADHHMYKQKKVLQTAISDKGAGREYL